jgi:hypothetical protein
LKIQKKWERDGDPGSWRREYDLYISELAGVFSDGLRWAECYHAEMSSPVETQLWIEYIEGASGDGLTIDMLERASAELGRFQGRLYKQESLLLQNISCFTEADALEKYYYALSSKEKKEYAYIRSEDCPIPEHLRSMIINIDNEAEKIFADSKKLPIVLCHRDFWLENIIYSDGGIIILDWDCTGWGLIGEDILQLIIDETDAKNWKEYYRRLVPAYFKGLSEYIDISPDYNYICKLLILRLGYDLVRWYTALEESSERKNEPIDSLQIIYEIQK